MAHDKRDSIAGDNAAVSDALGSERPQIVEDVYGGPLSLFALAHRFNERLKSSGGRPTDPSWNLSRRVPFSQDTWDALNLIAERISTPERRVAPAQIAAGIIESGVPDLEKAARHGFPDRPSSRWERKNRA